MDPAQGIGKGMSRLVSAAVPDVVPYGVTQDRLKKKLSCKVRDQPRIANSGAVCLV